MQPRSQLPAAVVDRLADQDHVITRQQALAAGLSSDVICRLCRDGSWTRLVTGIFLGHNHTPDWSALAWAGVLQAGPGAALGGRAAAFASGLIDRPPATITVLMPHDVRVRRAPERWRFRRSRVAFVGIGSPPRCGIERTVIDLCAAEPKRLAHWVTAAVGGRLTTAERLRAEAARHDRLPVRRQLEWILAETDSGVHSPLELLYRREVERAHGLPTARGQMLIEDGYCDLYYEEGAVVELDGRLGHDGVGVFRDMRRDNRNMVQGRPTLRFGWDQCLDEACAAAAQVAALLTSLGWTGRLRPCPRCPQTPGFAS